MTGCSDARMKYSHSRLSGSIAVPGRPLSRRHKCCPTPAAIAVPSSAGRPGVEAMRAVRLWRGAAGLLAIALLLPFAQGASAAPLGLTSCAAVQDVHQCSGLVKTWDG